MEPFSTRNLTAFPNPEALQRICKATAALDAILQAQEWLRYHIYFPDWGDGLQVGKVDDGSGDDLFCLFSPVGTVLKGFDHESPLSPHAQESYHVWPGIYDGLPAPLSALLDNPAFKREDVTFCLWQPVSGTTWKTGSVQFPPDGDDGSSFLLGTLFPTAEDYVDWAQAYYGAEIPLAPVQQVYERLMLDEETARQINPQADYQALRQEIQSILG